MTIAELNDIHVKNKSNLNNLVSVNFGGALNIEVYPNSITEHENRVFFIGKEGIDKSLFILSTNSGDSVADKFEGARLENNSSSAVLKRCSMNHNNVLRIQELFAYTKPVLLGLHNSFGYGDRIGLANPAHLRSLPGYDFKPILAQQSIRELTRTQRTPDMVMDAAVWAVFQEGYKDGFGADADHLKTPEDIDLMMANGFTMFTFDPGEYVINEADSLPVKDLVERSNLLPWNELQDSFEKMLSRYADKKFDLGDGLVISPSSEDVTRAIIKYGGAIAHIHKMNSHLVSKYSDKPFEVEVSVDETDSVTTIFEHFFIASELNRLGVKILSLAPRFIGDFEKGIDYKGDLKIFKEEYIKHLKVTEHFGSYKISLHSGSDKFSVYKVIGSLHKAYTHVKTAGTSYLEALRVVAATEFSLFREILDFAREEFELEKRSYHVSADSSKVLASAKYSDAQLLELFNQDDARQVLHVTFGRVLTVKNDKGFYIFKDRILDCLKKNENLHYKFILNHFIRHLQPFK